MRLVFGRWLMTITVDGYLLVMHAEEMQGRLLGSSVVYLSTCLSLSPRRWLGVEHPDSL